MNLQSFLALNGKFNYVCKLFIKPGMRSRKPRAPGFLKLLWFVCWYVCVCVCVYLCVRPLGH